MKEKSKEKLEKEVSQKLQQLNAKEKLEEIIKDNKIEFKIKDTKYRVHKPTQGETFILQKARNKKFLALLQDDSYILKEQLLEIYKKKGIDIEGMELEIKDIGYSIEDVQVKLDATTDKELIKTLKSEINDLFAKQGKIAVRISELLEPCIENSLIEFANLYMVYSVVEKVEDNKWVKVFDSYKKFLESDNEELILEATANLSLIVYKQKI